MPRRARMLLPVLLIAVLGCSTRRSPAPDTGASDVELYALLLSHAGVERFESPVLYDSTVAYRPLPTDSWLRHRKDTVPAALVNRLVALSATPRHVTDRAFGRPIRRVAASAGRRLAEDGLGGTYVLAVTPVAFSGDSTQALVYYDRRCGALCGGGYELWFVRGPNGRWILRQEMAHWMS